MPQKKVVKDYSGLLTNHLHKIKKELENRESTQKLNKIHNENLMRQYGNNVINEYTRIRNFLENAGPPGTRDRHHLEQRLKHYKELNFL